MTNTITASAGSPATTSPVAVRGYTTVRESSNRKHNLIGGEIAVVLGPARPRSGTLELHYATSATAVNALNLHSRAATYALVVTGLNAVNMTYVISDGGRVTLDKRDTGQWVVLVDYQEIVP